MLKAMTGIKVFSANLNFAHSYINRHTHIHSMLVTYYYTVHTRAESVCSFFFISLPLSLSAALSLFLPFLVLCDVFNGFSFALKSVKYTSVNINRLLERLTNVK